MIPSNIVPSQSLLIPKTSVDLIRRNLNINKQYGPTYNLFFIEQVDTVDFTLKVTKNIDVIFLFY